MYLLLITQCEMNIYNTMHNNHKLSYPDVKIFKEGIDACVQTFIITATQIIIILKI